MSSSDRKKTDIKTTRPGTAESGLSGHDFDAWFSDDKEYESFHKNWWWNIEGLEKGDEEMRKWANTKRRHDVKQYMKKNGILVPTYTPCERCGFEITTGTEDCYPAGSRYSGFYKPTVRCPKPSCPTQGKEQKNINDGLHNPAMPLPLSPGERNRKEEQAAEKYRIAQRLQEEEARALDIEGLEDEQYRRYVAALTQEETSREDKTNRGEKGEASFWRKLKGKGKGKAK